MGLASWYSSQSSPRSGTIGPGLLLRNFTALGMGPWIHGSDELEQCSFRPTKQRLAQSYGHCKV